MAEKPKSPQPHEAEPGETPPHPHDKPGETTTPSKRHVHWVWPLGLALAGIGSAAAFMLRGCWHAHMSWPIRYDEDFSYQVCPNCGIQRLFDEETFRGYGPYGYDLHELIAHERTLRMQRLRQYKERTAAQKNKKTEEESPERRAK